MSPRSEPRPRRRCPPGSPGRRRRRSAPRPRAAPGSRCTGSAIRTIMAPAGAAGRPAGPGRSMSGRRQRVAGGPGRSVAPIRAVRVRRAAPALGVTDSTDHRLLPSLRPSPRPTRYARRPPIRSVRYPVSIDVKRDGGAGPRRIRRRRGRARRGPEVALAPVVEGRAGGPTAVGRLCFTGAVRPLDPRLTRYATGVRRLLVAVGGAGCGLRGGRRGAGGAAGRDPGRRHHRRGRPGPMSPAGWARWRW